MTTPTFTTEQQDMERRRIELVMAARRAPGTVEGRAEDHERVAYAFRPYGRGGAQLPNTDTRNQIALAIGKAEVFADVVKGLLLFWWPK